MAGRRGGAAAGHRPPEEIWGVGVNAASRQCVVGDCAAGVRLLESSSAMGSLARLWGWRGAAWG